MAPRGSGGKIAPIANNNAPRDGPAALGCGRKGLKRRHARILDGSSALSRPALRRLARRAGVKRIGLGVYEEAPVAMRAWLSKIIADGVTFTEHARRMTVTTNDVLMALKRNGITLYGFAETERRRRLTRPLPRATLAAAAVRVATRAPRTPAAPGQAASQMQFTAPRAAAPAAAAKAPAPARLAPKLAAAKPAKKVATAPAAAAGTVAVSPERAQDIQAALAAYRDTEYARRSAASKNAVSTVLEWINGHMRGRNRPACALGELDVVLEALADAEAVMLDGDGPAAARQIYFVN